MRKRIGIYTGNISIGGQETMLIEFLKVLDLGKYDVELFIEEDNGIENFNEKYIPSNISYSFLTDKKLMQSIKKLKSKRTVFNRILYSIKLIQKKKISIKEFKKRIKDKDIIIDYDLGLLRYRHLLKLNDKKIIGWSHAGKGDRLKNKRKNKNILLYDYIVAINNEMAKGYELNYGQDIKVKMITNFLDTIKIEKLSEEINEIEKYGDYILSIGSLTDGKNYLGLIKGFEQYIIKNNDKKLKLLIIGDGKLKENISQYIKNNNLNHQILLLGRKENPYPYIKKCKLYVQSSKWEAFSLVLVEAMVFGKKIISQKNIGSKFVLDNGKYGILVDNIQTDLENELKKILIENSYIENYKEKLEERVLYFSKEKAKIKIEEFIDEI